MDAGSVLNALLARHNDFLNDTNAKLAHQQARRGHDAATSTARPPSKVMEAVQRGVNPLMLGVDTHKAETAAQEKTKQRRKMSRNKSVKTSEVLSKAPASQGQQKTRTSEVLQRKGHRKGEDTVKTPSNAPVPTVRQAELARNEAVSRTLMARHRELRAEQQNEAAELKKRARLDSTASASSNTHRAHSTSASGVAAAAGQRQQGHLEKDFSATGALTSTSSAAGVARGASPASSRRDIWRRRCTTRKILRLTRGVTKTAALRRYWYTNLSVLPRLPSPELSCETTSKPPPPSQQAAPPSPQSRRDEMEERCAVRRRQAARRVVLADFHARAAAPAAATAAPSAQTPAKTTTTTKTNQADSAPTPSPVRLTRSKYKAGIRHVLQQASEGMWVTAARVVAQRNIVMQELKAGCAAAVAAGRDGGAGGVLPLLLARHFPLFGVVVEVQELELRVPRLNTRSTRHRRRARYASKKEEKEDSAVKITKCGSCEGGRSAQSSPQLCVLQRQRGVVVEEYSDTVGVLLLPTAAEDQQAWAAAVQHASTTLPGSESEAKAAKADKANPAEDFARAAQGFRFTSAPRVVRVPKHFPGASGAFTELLPLMLAATNRGPTAKPGNAFRTSSAVSSRHVAKTRVLAAVFCGECMPSSPSNLTEEGDSDPTGAADAYPLKRSQNRCL